MVDYRISAICKDWREQWDFEHINQAFAFCGEGAQFTEVNDTRGDTNLAICANPPINEKQAQELFDISSFYIMNENGWKGNWNEIKILLQTTFDRIDSEL